MSSLATINHHPGQVGKTGMTTLPSIRDARLPTVYEAAVDALSQCAKLDECKDWADKAAALASYGKQSNDDRIRKYGLRIQARAVRRAGELLKQFNAAGTRNDQPIAHKDKRLTQRQAAERYGISPKRERTAIRVANILDEDFEAAVDSEHPSTVTALTEQGKKRRLVDLGGRDPKEFSISTDGQGQIHKLAQFTGDVEPGVVVRGAMPYEREMLIRDIISIEFWFDELMEQLED